MGARSTLVAFALLAAACGSGATSPGDPEWTNGSRLRARVYQSEDGARQWIAWRDTERDEDCYFGRTADGALHCLPAEAGFSDIFADAACAQAMMAASVECGAAPYAWHIEAPCDTGYTLHRRGARLEPQPAAYYFRDYDGACVGGGPTEPTVEYFALEPAEDLARFVAAELTQEPNGPVNNERLVAADGARQLTGAAFDPQSGARTGLWFEADSQRWLPDMYQGFYFADGACTDPIGCGYSYDSCPTTRTLAPYVQHSAWDATCQRTIYTYYEAGGPADERSLDDASAMQCVAVTPTPELECVATAGDSIPFASFPSYQEILLPGARVRARYDGIEGGGAVGPVWYYFHDTQLDVPCYPLTAIDGSFRCLPSFFIPYANLFEDMLCTIPAAYRHQPSDDEICWPTGPLPELVTWREPDTTPCAGGHFSDARRRTYRVGEVMPSSETAALFTADVGGCVPYDPAALPGPVHRIIEMAPAEFVTVEEVVE